MLDIQFTRILVSLILIAIYLQTALTLETNAEHNAESARSNTIFDNGLTRTLRHVYAQCADSEDIFRCFKVQGARLLGRALKVQQINVIDGVTLIRRNENETRTGRASAEELKSLSNRDLEQLSAKSLDALLMERFASFMHSRQLQVNLPRLLLFGERNSQSMLQMLLSYFTQADDDTTATGTGTATADMIGEGRHKKKGDDKKYLGPFIAAVLLKTAILKMAYHSIAIVAGKALIVGKIALIISAIIGLKKLVSTDGGEKTTYEIVKHPQVQQSHTYSASHQGEYEGGHDSGSYHRSIDDEMMMQDKAYHAWVPSKAT